MAREFDFRSQSYTVNQLLDAAVKALDHLPEGEKQALEAALERFETTCVPTAWSVNDIPAHLALSDDEARDALDTFYEDYDIGDREQEMLLTAAELIAKNRSIGP